MSKVSVQIVTWNSERYIFDCLESLSRQTFTDFSVMVIDNHSTDSTVKFVREHYPTVSMLQNFRNIGFTKAHNQGIHLAKGEYSLILNPDVILAEDFLANLVSFADQHPEGGSFGGKILKLQSKAIDDDDQGGLRQVIKSEIIDSAGLQIYKSRRVVDRGEGQRDEGQYNRPEPVFGISGACVLYRRSALNEVLIRNEYFDNNFFAYKEDIDLAWRLRLYGFESWYQPAALCYHYRGFGTAGRGFGKINRSRRSVSKLLRFYSFKNQHLLLVKNDQWLNLLLALPWFLLRELQVILYSLVFEPFQWRGVILFFRQLPETFNKRRVIMAHRKVQPREIRKWFE